MKDGPSPASEGRWATWTTHGAMAGLVLITLGFDLRLGLGLVDSLFAALLLFTLPMLSIAQLPFVSVEGLERLRAYASSAITIGILASVALVLGALGPGLEAMGLGPVGWDVLGSTAGIVAVGAALLVAVFHMGRRLTDTLESPFLRHLIPRTGPERTVFTGLSLVAGLGEEVIYRGYLLALLTPALGGAWVAAGVTSAAFGVLHAYQGPVGILRTGLLGFVFAASVVETGSLWPAVIVHTLVDLVGGLWFGPRTLEEHPHLDDAPG